MREALAAAWNTRENEPCLQMTRSRMLDPAYMLHPKVADTSALHLSLLNGIFDRSPAFQSLRLPTIWTMQQKQIDVAEPALLDGLFDRFSRRLVGRVGCQLRREVHVFPFQR